MERYDFDTNQMLICGVGSVPDRLRLRHRAGNFSPRVGLAYRAARHAWSIRAGYGINYDPYPLAFVRDMLGNYPSGIGLTVSGAEHVPVRRAASQTGIPAVTVPDVSSGIIPVPPTVGAQSARPGRRSAATSSRGT